MTKNISAYISVCDPDLRYKTAHKVLIANEEKINEEKISNTQIFSNTEK